jgi:xanthosine phosphorylase
MHPSHADISKNVAIIRQCAPNFHPKLGIILGSGVGKFADIIQDSVVIPFAQLPALRPCKVEGHVGRLHLGTINGLAVACFQGRNHLYEGYSQEVIQAPVRTLKQLGVETLILVSAVGSLEPDIKPGSLVVVSDHINLQFSNPLVGPNDDLWGPRFPNMEDAYDPSLRKIMANAAVELGIHTSEGVYIGVLGPSFETPAEIRAFKHMGADIVGMSTVPEVIAARHCDMKVVAVSVVTNMAAGMIAEAINHKLSLSIADQTVHDLSRLLSTFITRLAALPTGEMLCLTPKPSSHSST